MHILIHQFSGVIFEREMNFYMCKAVDFTKNISFKDLFIFWIFSFLGKCELNCSTNQVLNIYFSQS